MIEFFTQIKPVIIVVHALAAAVGLGAVVVTDTLFFNFLKNFKISQKEDSVLQMVSGIIWIAIVLLALTGTMLYLSGPLGYLAKSKFVVKVIIFGVIVLNGVILNWVLTPYLKKISFGPVLKEPSFKIRFLRRLAFASGAVSIISWLTVFILGSVRSIPFTVTTGILFYLGLCGFVIVGSQVYATWVKRHKIL